MTITASAPALLSEIIALFVREGYVSEAELIQAKLERSSDEALAEAHHLCGKLAGERESSVCALGHPDDLVKALRALRSACHKV